MESKNLTWGLSSGGTITQKKCQQFTAGGQQTTACRLNPIHLLIFAKKVYWGTATPICLQHRLCLLLLCKDRVKQLRQKPSGLQSFIFGIWPFTEVCRLLVQRIIPLSLLIGLVVHFLWCLPSFYQKEDHQQCVRILWPQTSNFSMTYSLLIKGIFPLLF